MPIRGVELVKTKEEAVSILKEILFHPTLFMK